MKKILASMGFVVLALFVIIGMIGCETTDGTSGLSISPSEAVLTNGARSVTFVVGSISTDTNGDTVVTGARELSVPLVWSVSKPSLGHITAIAGNKAVYEKTGGHGVNVITVRDQYDAEGIATVTQ